MSMMMGGGSKPKGAIVEFINKKREDKEADRDVGLRICMEELIEAVKAGDIDQAVAAFKAAFAECEMTPHREGPHIE